MGVQVIPIPTEVVSHSLTFPFPILCFIPIPMGFAWDSLSHWESHSHKHLYCVTATPQVKGQPWSKLDHIQYTESKPLNPLSKNLVQLMRSREQPTRQIWWQSVHVGFLGKLVKYRQTFCDFSLFVCLSFSQAGVEIRLAYRGFWRNGSKDAESCKGVPFRIKIQFLNVTPISPKMSNFDPKQVV